MLDKAEFSRLIPHAGDMCLLDQVLSWDENQIHCSTGSHRLTTNPLRCKQGLSSIHCAEYGAQAMALHGALSNTSGRTGIESGLLASIRKLHLHTDWIDQVEGPMTVRAECLMGAEDSMIYAFNIEAAGERLADGQVMVISSVAGSS